MAVTDKVRETADQTKETADSATETAQEAASGASSKATGATSGVRGILKDQVTGALSEATKEVIAPAIQQMSEQAARQAVDYAKTEGPRLIKEQVLPQIMKATGADNPGDLVKQGIGKVGESISDSGGVTGIAGKLMSKMGGGKGGGQATGYGQKRRMPVQQDMFVSVSLEDAYKGWTEYKRWPEFMHRANQVDPQIEESDQGGDSGGSASLAVTEKMWGFTRPFTAEVISQVPNEHIRWKSTQGTKHVGVIAFHGIAPRLTLISVNIDHAPSGPVEKIARGARFDKRAIRADLHRFKGWMEHQSTEELEEIEGWLGTIEDGQITETHDDYMSQQEAESGQEDESNGRQDEDTEGAGQGRGQSAGRGEEDGEGGQEGEQEGEEGDHVEEPQAEEDMEEDEDDEEEDEEDEDEEPEASEEDEEDEDEEDEDEEPEAESEEDDEEDEEEQPKAKQGGNGKSATRSKPKARQGGNGKSATRTRSKPKAKQEGNGKSATRRRTKTRS